MEKAIEDKVYNTEKAELLHKWHSNNVEHRRRVTDFGCYEEALFQAEDGSYFLYGAGGPASKYAVKVNNGFVEGGKDITPLTAKEALSWLKDHDGDQELINQIGKNLRES